MKKIFLLFFLIGSFSIQAQDIPQQVKDVIKARVDEGINPSIVVAYIDGDNVSYFNYGNTTWNDGTPVNEQTVYEIGSISKVFTGILLAEQVINRNIKLNDPIANYLPASVSVPQYKGKSITFTDMATHTSALPRMPDNFTPADPQNPYVDYSVTQLYDFISGYTLTREIGGTYQYSNYAMGLLGHILALQNNSSYEELMVSRIANKLNMKDTRVALTDTIKKHLALGHSGSRQVSNWDIISLAGAGGIRSSASDMVKFLKANMSPSRTSLGKAMSLSHDVHYEKKENNFKMGLGWHYMNDNIIWHNGATGGYTAFTGFVKGTQKGVVVLTNSTSDVNDIGLKLLNPTSNLTMPKKSIAKLLQQEIDANGIEKGIALYDSLKKKNDGNYNFEEGELNRLGYDYLNNEKIAIAIALFKKNVAEFPKASNPYDSLGEAYLKNGDTELAIANYTKSVQLNPANTNGIEALKKMGIDTNTILPEVRLSETVLERYVGTYELTPTFLITITRKDDQLFGQATGQNQFELFPRNETKFYLKIVEASITFSVNNKNETVSLTLHQGGFDQKAKKIK